MHVSKLIVSLILVAGMAAGVTAISQSTLPASENAAAARKSDGNPARTPAALRDLLARYDANPSPEALAEIDAAAGQRDAVHARLFWYTDLDAALTAARAENKPILYLRMLGKLTDEYSCANSRFFRTVLYANERVSNLLREKFVLVWVSERPVPVATIDFGDGRVLKRTITGNSAHYVLEPSGRVVDALPGLLDPVTFERLATEAWTACTRNDRNHARRAAVRVRNAWATEIAGISASAAPAERPAPVADAEAAGDRAEGKRSVERPIVRAIAPQPTAAANVASPTAASPAPSAVRAGERAVSKSLGELSIVRALTPAVEARDADAALWDTLADKHLADASLDAPSRALMRSQYPGLSAEAFERMVAKFQKAVAVDSVRNSFWFRAETLAWIAENPGISVTDLNARVYGELFLTPASDPWLGLVDADVYAAVAEGGCTSACR